MSQTDHSQPKTSAPWWDTESLSSARSSFRNTLQEKNVGAEKMWNSWMHFFIIGNARGLTRTPALCLAEMVASDERRGVRPEKAVARSFLGAITRMGFRGLLALAEQVDVSLDTLQRVRTQVEALFSEDHCSAADHAALRLGIASRLGLEPGRADVSTLWDAWLEFRRREKEHEARKVLAPSSGDDDDDDDDTSFTSGFSAFCPAAVGQILADSLFVLNDSEAALSITEQAVGQNACIGPCGLAPQGMLSTGIIHLHRAGNTADADDYCERLGRVAPLGHAWLLPAGARAWHMARTGNYAEARSIISQGSNLAGNHETSAWHRMQFHHHAAEVCDLIRQQDLAEVPDFGMDPHHLLISISLAEAFDERNGNDGVSSRLKHQFADMPELATA